ncbi:hypothetical protein M3Y99_01346400 [Aphelenchoides fujianensis]|nr:hypothetical protein M3Y99_01346400 [Aphelenchoides fujianensis]
MSDIAAPSLNTAAELSTTGHTVEWVLRMLVDHNPKFEAARDGAKVEELTAYDISEGKGYLSRVYKCTARFDRSQSAAYSFIMKIPTFDCLATAMEDMQLDKEAAHKFEAELSDAHNVECAAYELLRSIHDFPRPEVFFLERSGDGKPGLIVMEDLSGRAVTIGIYESMRAAHLLAAARHFARFQAQINRLDGWRGKFQSNFHISSMNRSELPKMYENFLKNAPDFKPMVERLQKVKQIEFSRFALRDRPKELGATTLAAGDCWANNVMLAVNADGSVGNEIASFIDWQIAMEGNPLFDLARLTVMCADAEIRRSVEDELVPAYFEELERACAPERPPFTREQAEELFELACIQQTFEAVMMASFFIVQQTALKVTPRVHEGQKHKLLLRVRFALQDAFELMEKHGIEQRFVHTEV